MNGYFKNSDNSVVFLDYVKTETKEYWPIEKSTIAIDKGEYFSILLSNIAGETLKDCTIICHDIFENSYQFRAKFTIDEKLHNDIILENSLPEKNSGRAKSKKEEKKDRA